MRRLFPLLLVLGSCNPYNPDLGQDPFRCGTDEPRCPDGYQPNQVNPTLCLCEKGLPPLDASGGDGGPFMCNQDPNEDPDGNDSTADPTPTSIGTETMWQASALAICPGTDADVFTMPLTAGQTATVTVQFSMAQGDLQLDILNSSETSLVQGTVVGAQLRAVYSPGATTTYFARVKGTTSDVQNNYDIQINVQ